MPAAYGVEYRAMQDKERHGKNMEQRHDKPEQIHKQSQQIQILARTDKLSGSAEQVVQGKSRSEI